ncbi:malto-oligosyltrehalose trehalohydrolase [Geomonas sp.]|uniref:malto-oligosyltrehalose trehalohydrolase n=1 Tax=Geomonas sp. TaxID=2651584 RepID=UPI002B48CB1C|nr:malto-oligosyltrehalose trehalohydrolase [Geomonas sp.]HJV35470.1 malto-oligosyltrehalose trehalohydrolase [Geomonas sp.]
MVTAGWQMDIGANVVKGEGTRFRVWAPRAEKMSVLILSGKAVGTVTMEKEEFGYFSALVPGVEDGDQYIYQIADQPPRPDPVSRFQPNGVNEMSQVVDPTLFNWQDAGWSGIPLEEYRIYELHIGTFTREGTFEAAIGFLDYLLELGISAVEIMPVSQFSGDRNWGYDGVHHFAPQNTYGGPGGMKRFVDACHRKGLAVILDVVYNHFGPEGNHIGEFGYYFTDKYRTPWGGAINFDGPYSDPVLEFFMCNAMYWINEFHIDALRLDAVDWIFDMTPRHFLLGLSEEVRRQRELLARQIFLFAENDTNDARLINPPEIGGYGIDSQWCDNFHHALRTLLTGETTGYYEDFGQFSQMVKAYQEAYVFTGEYSHYRRRRYGGEGKGQPTSKFVVFAQNHDQVGNRKCGDRLSTNQPLEKLLLAAGVVILSPYIPLIFMGEEYGERAPFHYFISHTDQELIDAVRKGKHEEHASGVCEGEIPDPSAESVFLECKLDLIRKREGEQALILEFYKKLLSLRRLPAMQVMQREGIEVMGMQKEKTLCVRRQSGSNGVVCMFSFSNMHEDVSVCLPAGSWEKVLDSSDQHWRGSGSVTPGNIVAEAGKEQMVTISPFSVLVYVGNNIGG